MSGKRATRAVSLKTRLGIGAAILGAGTLITALILVSGLNAVSERLTTALEADARIARYATLSQQAATFLVISTEMVQSGQSADVRRDRIAPVIDRLKETFQDLHAGTEAAVNKAREAGLDAQSRFATQSLDWPACKPCWTAPQRTLAPRLKIQANCEPTSTVLHRVLIPCSVSRSTMRSCSGMQFSPGLSP